MTKILKCTLFFFPFLVYGQYPFEKYKKPKCTSFEFKRFENENVIKYSKAVKTFFHDKTDVEVSVNGNTEDFKKTYIEVKTQSNSSKYFEEIPAQGTENLYIADFNGDGKKDIKVVIYYMGCGLASLNVRVIYLFQKENKRFTRLSFDDNMGENLPERDFDGDGNFEIITKTLQYHKKHNYWLFNIYNFSNGNLLCVNSKMNYPIMVQYLDKENYTVTRKISRKEMKKYEMKKPEDLLIGK
jgi:hypothetical protein